AGVRHRTMPFVLVIVGIYKLSLVKARPAGMYFMPTRIRFQPVERHIGIKRKTVIVHQLPPLRTVSGSNKGCIIFKENLPYEISLYGKTDFSSVVYKMLFINCTSCDCFSKRCMRSEERRVGKESNFGYGDFR